VIKTFSVYNRRTIEALEPNDVPHVIVSITTPYDDHALINTNENTLGILRLSFHDLDRVLPETEHLEDEMFNEFHAREILDFVESHPSAEHFIVHCDAGLSRSPGVAAAMSKIILGDDEYFFKRYHPNMRVYGLILSEHHNKRKQT